VLIEAKDCGGGGNFTGRMPFLSPKQQCQSTEGKILGHILSDDVDDASDINRIRVKLISQINSVICYFHSLYGCELWDFVHPDLNRVCTACRVGVRRAWNLPYRTHSNLLPLISLQLPLVDEVAKRILEFSRKCLSSDSKLVSRVAYHALLSARINSFCS